MSDGVVNIKGKNYKLVAARVEEFNEQHPDWGIVTNLLHHDDDRVIVQATITSPDGRVLGSGLAEEERASSNINRTSAIENCETSAIGRALASIGLAGGDSYGSADEVARAMEQQGLKEFKEAQVQHMNAIRDNLDSVYCLVSNLERHLFSADDSEIVVSLQAAAEAWGELTDHEKAELWRAPSKGGILTTKMREVMQSSEFAQARGEVA